MEGSMDIDLGTQLQGVEITEEDILKEHKNSTGRLSELAKKYEAYFVHGLHPFDEFGGVNNSSIKPGTTFLDRASVVSDLHPTISGSSVLQHSATAETWSPIGLVLGDGVIEDASPSDMLSRSHSLYDRRPSATWLAPRNPEQYNTKIDTALKTRGIQPYNELIVQGPKPAGVYLNLDSLAADKANVFARRKPSEYALQETFVVGGRQMSYRELEELGSQLGMQVFVFVEGKLRRTTFNEENGGLLIGDVINAGEVGDIEPVLTPEQRSEMHERAKSSLAAT
ncbi:MAG: hypothetical protein KBC15_00520 [Candidatus Levybacteria bacterium]|nr:hypothetical protein [Candidatus Levybacteria bacterium]